MEMERGINMNGLKKYWYVGFILIITAGLGIMTFLTSQKLTTTKPVAPTVPQATPKAAEPACILTFNIATPTSTPTNTPTGTPTNTPTNTPSPTPKAGCNNSCTVNDDCQSGYVCDGGACRNPSCTTKTNCVCDLTPTPTPVVALASCNNTCVINTDCKSGLVCIDGACRNPTCTEKTNCSCEVAAAAPTPKVPVSGAPSVLGASVVVGGLFFLLLGLAL